MFVGGDRDFFWWTNARPLSQHSSWTANGRLVGILVITRGMAHFRENLTAFLAFIYYFVEALDGGLGILSFLQL